MFFSIQENQTPLQESARLIASARLVLWSIAQMFLLIDYLYLELPYNVLHAELILSLFLMSAIFSFAKLRSKQRITGRYIHIQLVSDVFFMTLLFHVTGASANPFVSLLLFPLTISAATLSSRFTLYMALLTLSSYGSLYLIDIPSFGNELATTQDHHAHHMHHSMDQEQSAFSLHLIGMWFNFALSAALISFFLIRMRQQIKIQQNKINEQREQLLRDEQLLGIATQAASAAHHMSTPLSTMAVLVEDLKSDEVCKPISEDLEVLSAQIGNCTHVLDDLRHQANFSRQEELVSDFIDQLLDEFKLLRPGIELERKINDPSFGTDTLSSDPSLRMAILNILNNAADASPAKVSFQAQSNENTLDLIITDFGQHDENKVSRILGAAEQPLESDKEHGMGIGLFLSHATINRHQGSISVEASKEKGTLVHISLALNKS
jgi:two-component system sensor histidine kinase RegB